MPRAFIAFQQRWWWQVGVVEGMSGQAATTVLVAERLSGRQRGGQGPLHVGDHLSRWGIAPGASPFPIAGPSVHRTSGAERGLPGGLEGSKRLACLRFARQGGTASWLPGLAFLVTRLAPPLIDRALGLWLAEFGVDQEPAWWHAALEGGQLTIALGLGERCHGLRVHLGQGGLGVAYSGGNTGDPLPGRLGELLPVGFTREGPIGHHVRHAVGDVQRVYRGASHLANVLGLTAVATVRSRIAGVC